MSLDSRAFELAIVLAASVVAAAGAFVHASRVKQTVGRLVSGSWRWLPRPPSSGGRMGSPWLVAGASICLAAAVALNVAHGRREREVGGPRVIVLAMDVSQSMYATDVEPTRMERARSQTLELVRLSQGFSFGVVAFGGDGTEVLPVTPDRDSVSAALKGLGPGSVATRGSSIGQGLALAIETVRLNHGEDVIVVSDGESTQDDDLLAATLKRAVELGIRIHTVSVGTAAGSPVPADSEGGAGAFKTNADGQPVVTHADEAKMQRLSDETSGYHASADPSGSYLHSLMRATTDPASARRGLFDPELVLILVGALLVTFDGLKSARRHVRERLGQAKIRSAPSPASL